MIALFDLDDTLLDGDSNELWGRYLVERGLVDATYHTREQQRFTDDYLRGAIDFRAYLTFTLSALRGRTPAEVARWQQEVAERFAPAGIFPGAVEQLAAHRARGHRLVMITATNRCFAEPFAARLGMDALLASEVEQDAGRFTGYPAGEPCYREGKLGRFRDWLRHTGLPAPETWFYSDSHNDLPLLEQVAHPVAVNPDETLRAVARRRAWPVVVWRSR